MLLTGTPSGVGPVRAGDYLYGSLGQAQEEIASLYMKVAALPQSAAAKH